jgi:hypothetical protein
MTQKLKVASYNVRPDHMEQLGKIAAAQGLNASAMLRVVVAAFVKRENRRAKKDTGQK